MRKRLLLLSLFAVLVIGGAATGVYFIRAAGEETAASADETAAAAEAAPEATTDGDKADEKPPVPVHVAEVSVGSVSTYISTTSNLVPEDEVRVLAEAEGRLTRLLVEEGDRVGRGQLLATLLQDEATITVNKAELKADNARLAWERASRMADQQLISREEFDRITMDHRIAQQELAEARWRLDKTEIRAPFDGRLTRRNVTLGQHVRPGDELFTVTDFDPLIARIYLPEKDILGLTEGRKVRITLKADEAVRFHGMIRQISPVVDTSTGTVKVTVAATDPPASVRPGGFVTVDITRETRESALLVPKQAVIRELSEAHVFLADEQHAVRRPVKIGLEEGDRLEIVAGVDADDRVIVAGQGGLKDGSKIKVLSDATQQAAETGDETPQQVHG